MPEVFYQREGPSPDAWDLIGAPETSTVALSTVTTLHYADGSPDDTLPANTAAVVWGTADTTFDRRAFSYLLFTVVGSGTLSVIKHADLATLTDDYAVLGRVTLGGVLPWQQGAGALTASGSVTHIPTDCLDFPNHGEICNDTPSELHYTMDDTAGSPAVHRQTINAYVLPGGHEIQEITSGGSMPDTSYQTLILADSPLAYWPLGSAPAGVTPDATGNGYDGTVTDVSFADSLQCPRNGLTATFFSGSNISCNIAGPLATTLPWGHAWSAEGWLAGPTFSDAAMPLAWGNTGLTSFKPNCTEAFVMGPTYPVLVPGGFHVEVGDQNGGLGPDWSPTSAVDFHYWAITFDPSTVRFDPDFGTDVCTLSLYRDGVLLDAQPCQIPADLYYPAPDFLLIGALPAGSGLAGLTSETTDCRMDNIALYTYVLTPEQVAAHYAAGIACGGGSNSLVAKDASGNLLWEHTDSVFTIYAPAGTLFATIG